MFENGKIRRITGAAYDRDKKNYILPPLHLRSPSLVPRFIFSASQLSFLALGFETFRKQVRRKDCVCDLRPQLKNYINYPFFLSGVRLPPSFHLFSVPAFLSHFSPSHVRSRNEARAELRVQLTTAIEKKHNLPLRTPSLKNIREMKISRNGYEAYDGT